jgi:deoxyribodipyrimidine photo-lyase
MNLKRLTTLKEGTTKRTGNYILYWMQQAQRVHFNHALDHAIQMANQYNLPVLVYFGLTSGYPDANIRHYQFMLEGLKEVKDTLAKFHISFVLKLDSPEIGILPLMEHAHTLVMDMGYLKHQVRWRKDVVTYADQNFMDIKIDIVDTDMIVPVHVASDKAEYGAYTLRPKIKRLYQEFRDFKRISTLNNLNPVHIESDDDLFDLSSTLSRLNLDQSVHVSLLYHGGYLAFSKLFIDFVMNKANSYKDSNDPSKQLTSKFSMYLHFGQISSLDILERMMVAQSQGQIDGESFDQFIEQLLVRRELAFNYVTFQKGYDDFNQMTEPWAYMTMREHELDRRDYLYSKEELEHSQTHDPYFNAAMKEMFITGYMHNYMRMYWAKKIIEWMPSLREAYETIMSLNNKYFIDGRDANSYAGVAWCFGKHDRAWTERHVFGKLRYMNDKGLERKFEIDSYVNWVNSLRKP